MKIKQSVVLSCLNAVCAFIVFGMGSNQLSATTLLSDNFAGTVGQQPAGWYGYNSNAAGAAATYATDSVLDSAGTVLSFAGGSNNTVMVRSFASTTLAAAGDYIQYSVSVRYTAAPTAATSGPLLGLLNSGGTALTSNSFGTAGATANDVGYELTKLANTTSNDVKVFAMSASATPFYTFGTAVSTTSSGTTASDTSIHNMSVTLTLAANLQDLIVTSVFDGYTTNYTILAASTLTFDEAILAGAGGQNSPKADFDNLIIITNVPEPSIAWLLGASIFGLFLMRRRLVAA